MRVNLFQIKRLADNHLNVIANQSTAAIMNDYLRTKLRSLSIVATFFVVFVHSFNLIFDNPSINQLYLSSGLGFTQNFISQGITRVASPLFFLISGYLFFSNLRESSKSYFLKVKGRVNTLLIPYLFWSFWGLLFFFIVQSIPQLTGFFSNNLVTSYSVSELVSTWLLNPIPYQLWFLRDLMMLVLLAPLLYYLVKFLGIFALPLFMVTWFMEIDFILFDGRSLLFFMTGLYLSRNPQFLTEKRFGEKANMFLFLWITLSLIKTTLVFYADDYYLIGFIHKISVLFGILALFSLYDKLYQHKDISKSPWFKYFSLSFFIYTSHEPILTVAKKTLFFVLGKSDIAMLINYFSAPIIAIAICLIVGNFIRGNMPRLYKFVSGGR